MDRGWDGSELGERTILGFIHLVQMGLHNKKNKAMRLVVLGEDGGNYFPGCANYGGKNQFTIILSEALSLWNNIEL